MNEVSYLDLQINGYGECTILDCSPCGMLLENVSRSRSPDCLIDQRDTSDKKVLSLRADEGEGNMVVDTCWAASKISA